jgi:hypothetical protein
MASSLAFLQAIFKANTCCVNVKLSRDACNRSPGIVSFSVCASVHFSIQQSSIATDGTKPTKGECCSNAAVSDDAMAAATGCSKERHDAPIVVAAAGRPAASAVTAATTQEFVLPSTNSGCKCQRKPQVRGKLPGAKNAPDRIKGKVPRGNCRTSPKPAARVRVTKIVPGVGAIERI